MRPLWDFTGPCCPSGVSLKLNLWQRTENWRSPRTLSSFPEKPLSSIWVGSALLGSELLSGGYREVLTARGEMANYSVAVEGWLATSGDNSRDTVPTNDRCEPRGHCWVSLHRVFSPGTQACPRWHGWGACVAAVNPEPFTRRMASSLHPLTPSTSPTFVSVYFSTRPIFVKKHNIVQRLGRPSDVHPTETCSKTQKAGSKAFSHLATRPFLPLYKGASLLSLQYLLLHLLLLVHIYLF